MKTRINSKNAVRDSIVKAAVKILGECGIRKLAQPQIAKRARVPQGHMTYYFPTRSDLLLAVAEKSFSEIVESVLKNAKAFQKDLSAHSLALLLPSLKDKSRTRMMIGLFVESEENPKLKANLQGRAATAKSLIAMTSGHGVDSPHVSLAYAAIIGLGVLHTLGSGDEKKDEKQLADALELLAKKIKGEKHGISI